MGSGRFRQGLDAGSPREIPRTQGKELPSMTAPVGLTRHLLAALAVGSCLLAACALQSDWSGIPVYCSKTSECPANWYCTRSGICSHVPDGSAPTGPGTCANDLDCLHGMVCNRSRCAECAGDADCADGQFCALDGACHDLGAACTSDRNCGSGTYCSDSRCRFDCREDSHCTGNSGCDTARGRCKTGG